METGVSISDHRRPDRPVTAPEKSPGRQFTAKLGLSDHRERRPVKIVIVWQTPARGSGSRHGGEWSAARQGRCPSLSHCTEIIVRESRGNALVMEDKLFRQEEIEAISAALGKTGDGLTGSEIGHILSVCRMADPSP